LATEQKEHPQREPLLVHATLASAPEPADAVSFGALFAFVGRHLALLGVAALLGAAAAYAASFLLAPVYRSEAVLEPVSIDDVAGNLGGLGSKLGGVAGLLGVDIGKGGTSTAASLAIMKSRRLLNGFIERNNLRQVLYANRWDARAKQWSVGPSRIPTVEDAYLLFTGTVLDTREDKKSGLIVVSVDWRNAEQAARWCNQIVAETNRYVAAQAAGDAQRNIDFLNAELPKAADVGLRQAIYSLIESEVKKGMLARTRVDYAFRVLDPAAPPAPRRYIRPQRFLFAVGGAFGVALVVGLALLVRERRRAAIPVEH
jgi:uncharacterized protein involved in exopolysaccharide biosynthesis